jgi:hypothetical protein
MAAPPALVIQVSNCPTSVLLGTKVYPLTFLVKNSLADPSTFEVKVSAQSANIGADPRLQSPFELGAGEASEFAINIQPTLDGLVVITLDGFHHQVEQFTQMVWKVRETVSEAAVRRLQATSYLTFEDFSTVVASLPGECPKAQEQISGAEARNKVMKFLNPDPSLSGDAEAPVSPTELEADMFIAQVVRDVAAADAAACVELVKQIHSPRVRDVIVQDVVPFLAVRSPGKAVEMALGCSQEGKRDELLSLISKATAKQNPQDAVMYALNISSVAFRDGLLKDMVFWIAESHPDIATNIVFQISDQDLQKKVLFEVIRKMAAANPVQAIESLQSLIGNV